MRVNWFLVAAGLLMGGGAVTEVVRGNWQLTIIYLSYTVANFTLATL